MILNRFRAGQMDFEESHPDEAPEKTATIGLPVFSCQALIFFMKQPIHQLAGRGA